jgi:Ring finger domain
MLRRHFYLIHHEFISFDRFQGWILTTNNHRYKIIIATTFSCSCQRFHRDDICKHFLFVLKRVFNVNLYAFDLRLALMQYHQLSSHDLERIFRGQRRRQCPIVLPTFEHEHSSLPMKRQSIDTNDVCPICFERLLLTKTKLVTCFVSCGKSMHAHCMIHWKRINRKSIRCPFCQAQWISATVAQKAVLDYYAHRSHANVKQEKYIFCCLYTPPNSSS